MNNENEHEQSTTSKLIKGGIRSIAASIPVAASLGQAWNEYEGHLQSERINKFFHEFGEELKRQVARIQSVEAQISQSGEFAELLEKAVSSARRTSSDEKIKRLARALVTSVSAGETIHYDEKLSSLDALDSLTEDDIRILGQFADQRTKRVDHIFRVLNLRGSNEDEQLGLLILSLSKLEARAIIGETSSPSSDVIAGVGDFGSWYNRWRAKYYVILPFGRILVSILSSKL